MKDLDEARAHGARGGAGVGDRYAECQPASRPRVDATLVGKRIDACFCYYLDEGGSELRWSQDGEVLKVSDGTNIKMPPPHRTKCYPAGQAVLVGWDADPAREEAYSESPVALLPSKWNPKVHSAGAWRLDLGERPGGGGVGVRWAGRAPDRGPTGRTCQPIV